MLCEHLLKNSKFLRRYSFFLIDFPRCIPVSSAEQCMLHLP